MASDFLTDVSSSIMRFLRNCGFLISSSRSRARGRPVAIAFRASQASAANRPKMANGKSCSKFNNLAAAKSMASDLDVDDFTNGQGAEYLHDDGAGQ